MSLKSAIQDLNDSIKDLTSLHVQTYSGKVNISRDKSITFDTLRDALNKPGDGGVKLDVTLMLETLIQFDGDSYNFVANESVPDELFKLHKDAVEAGLKTRLGLLETMKDLLKLT